MLSDQIDYVKKLVNPDIPPYILDNLTPKFSIRPYQEEAIKNFLIYDRPELVHTPNQVLFHMATGSGKTLIMASLILHHYVKGYRNFVFFVHLDNILQKTKDNFLNKRSIKYLFAEKIVINGKEIKIREVHTFEESDNNCINICFTTIQGLHSAFVNPRENTVSIMGDSEKDIVFISDEAHHLTVDTKAKKKDEEGVSWQTVVNSYFRINKKNVLLEFTATCDLNNPQIKNEYDNKIVFQYDLKKYRKEGYSKEIDTLVTNLDYPQMAILACLLSQYRLKMFNSLKINIKPTILFKSKTIKDSKSQFEQILSQIESLNADEIEIYSKIDLDVVRRMFHFFKKNAISNNQLAQEIKDSFSREHCVMVNESTNEDANNDYVALNTLEDLNNPIRAIFEVEKLDEGWDVLNLYDIVRLYDTRDAKNGIPGPTTIREAQLIGRGARYCPFILDDVNEKYKRKFDADLDNPYRVCETMYYHCKTNSKYIVELRAALTKNGMLDPKVVHRNLYLKESFKKTQFYNNAEVFVNSQVESDTEGSESLPASIRSSTYAYSAPGKQASMAILFEDRSQIKTVERRIISRSISSIAELNYNTVDSALRRYPVFDFSNLKRMFPSLKSKRQFILDSNYLGDICIDLSLDSDDEESMMHWANACVNAMGAISDKLLNTNLQFRGSEKFTRKKFKEVFGDKRINFTDPSGDGPGMPQSSPGVYQLDLSEKDWYVFNENYGTSEEKSFVKFFSNHYDQIKEKYDEVYLVRNERQLHIYSFDEGKRFEPDFLLFLKRKGKEKEFDQFQAFIEPKGDILLEQDRWKQEFLLQLRKRWVGSDITFLDDSEFVVLGLPFYNEANNKEFVTAFGELLIDESREGFQ